MTVFKSTDYHSSSAVHACPRVKSPGHRLGRCASPFSWTQVNLTFLCGVSVQLVKRWKLYALVLYDILHKSSDVLRYITTRLSQANTVGKNACRRVKETHIAESHVAVCRCNIPVSSIHRPPPFWLWIVHQESLLKIVYNTLPTQQVGIAFHHWRKWLCWSRQILAQSPCRKPGWTSVGANLAAWTGALVQYLVTRLGMEQVKTEAIASLPIRTSHSRCLKTSERHGCEMIG